MAGKLKDTKIKNAKPKPNEDGVIKDYALSDGSGLQILIKKNGNKLWEFIYKSPTLQKRRKTTLGNYPQTTLSTARDIRDEYLDLIKQGIDPIDKKRADEKQKELQSKSNFEQLANEWLEFEAKRTTDKTHTRKKAIMVNDCYPFIGKKYINEITHQDIIQVIEMRLKKTIHKSSIKAKQNNGIETANKLFNYMNTVFKYAITKGIIKNNPFNDIIKDLVIPKVQTIHHPKITDTTDLKKLVNDIYNYKGHYSTINALKFVLHIPLRAENLTKLKWDYINFNDESLTIPRNLMKVTNINLPDFKVPLSSEALNILKEQYELTGYQEYVFLSVQNKPINRDTPNMALKRMGYQDKQTVHGIRGVFRSIADTLDKEHNCSFETKERFLDHYEGSQVKKAYTHKSEHFEQMKPLVKWWSNYLEEML